jgi:hypothetical protein
MNGPDFLTVHGSSDSTAPWGDRWSLHASYLKRCSPVVQLYASARHVRSIPASIHFRSTYTTPPTNSATPTAFKTHAKSPNLVPKT